MKIKDHITTDEVMALLEAGAQVDITALMISGKLAEDEITYPAKVPESQWPDGLRPNKKYLSFCLLEAISNAHQHGYQLTGYESIELMKCLTDAIGDGVL